MKRFFLIAYVGYDIVNRIIKGSCVTKSFICPYFWYIPSYTDQNLIHILN